MELLATPLCKPSHEYNQEFIPFSSRMSYNNHYKIRTAGGLPHTPG